MPREYRVRCLLSFAALAAALSISAPRTAYATVVSGSFSYDNGTPAKNRQLHFENRATEDMYIAPTTDDGSFSAELPPGTYDLRAERGVILHAKVVVGQPDGTLNVGHVVEPAPLDVRRPFEHEGVSEIIVQNPAPATANLHGRPMEAMRFGGGYRAVQPLGGPPPTAMNWRDIGHGATADTNPPAPAAASAAATTTGSTTTPPPTSAPAP